MITHMAVLGTGLSHLEVTFSCHYYICDRAYALY